MSLSRKAMERLIQLAQRGARWSGNGVISASTSDLNLLSRARAALLPQEKRAGRGRGQKAKGKAGEQEAVHLLRPVFPGCKRGFQSRGGGKEQADVIETGPFHVEVKRTEALSVYKAMEQAIADAPGEKVPLVLHRRNGRFWLAVLRAEDLLALYACGVAAPPGIRWPGFAVYDPTLDPVALDSLGACAHGVPHRWPCEICDTEPREGQERES